MMSSRKAQKKYFFYPFNIMDNTIKSYYYNNHYIKKYYKTLNLFKKNLIQKGGGYSIDYMNNKIKFDLFKEDEIIKIYLHKKDEECIFVLIDKKKKKAYIEGISNNKFSDCFDNTELNKGFHFMEIIIKMLKKYKDKFNINIIQLKDNSFLYCNNKTKIWLSSLSFLQHNNTFYGRFGFMPIDKLDWHNYLENKKILLNNPELDLNTIINNWTFSLKLEIKKNIIKYYNKKINFMDWFNKISHKYLLEECEFFNYLIDKIYKELKLTQFKHESFFLII